MKPKYHPHYCLRRNPDKSVWVISIGVSTYDAAMKQIAYWVNAHERYGWTFIPTSCVNRVGKSMYGSKNWAYEWRWPLPWPKDE